MLCDYYSILDVPFGATLDEIKKAYRKQAHIWHPDKNPGKDTVKRMQEINEAYLILSDAEARAKYDKEYKLLFIQRDKSNKSNFKYDIQDEILKDWVKKAKNQAESLARLSLEDMFGITKAAVFGGLKGVLFAIIVFFYSYCLHF